MVNTGFSWFKTRLVSSSPFSACSILTWVGRWLLDVISPSIMVLSEWFFQLQSFQIVLHNLIPSYVWIPLPAPPSITKLLHLLTQLSFSIISIWPNHLSCICCMATEIPCIPSLFRISSEGLPSDRLMLYIHLATCISVRWNLQVSSISADHISQPYIIALLTQDL